MQPIEAAGIPSALPRHRALGAGTSAIALLALLAAGGPARAADGEGQAATQVAQAATQPTAAKPGESGQLEEIVVTARYRKEDVQTTPISITALSGDQMEERGYQSVIDVANAAPNVTIEPSQGLWGKSAQAFIRGVGQIDFDYAVSPGVGFYIDNVYFDSVEGSQFDLMDLDHVEVERGPQGTLYGKNTEGGAIRLFTVQPKGDDSGYVEAGYGSYNRERFKAAFDFSVIPDKLMVRVSAGSNTSDGYQDIVDFACAHKSEAGSLKPATTSADCVTGTLGGQDVQDARVSIRALPTDGLEINFSANVLDDRGEAAAQTELALNSGPTSPLGKQYNASFPSVPTFYTYSQNYLIPTYGIPIDSRFIPSNPYITYVTYRDPVTGLTATPQNTILDYGFTGTIDWDAIPGIVHAKSITAFESYSGYDGYSNTPLPFATILGVQTTYHRQVSQELDLTGNTEILGNKLEWTAGGYYLDSANYNGGWVDFGDNLSFVVGAFQPYAFQIADHASDSTEAGFLHSVYHITDQLSFEAGYRYSVEDRQYIFNHNYIYTTVPEAPLVAAGTNGTFSFPRSDAKAALQFQWTPDLMTYALVSTGFKAGGINPRPFNALQVFPFNPEDLTAYEVGFKSQFFDNHLRVNGDAFLSNYKNLQQSLFLFNVIGPGPCLCYENVGHVLIEGLEGEIQATPVSGLLLNAAGGYLDYNVLTLGSAPVGGRPQPIQSLTPGESATPWPIGIPKWKLNLGGQYTAELGEYGELTGRLDWTYQSRVFWDTLDTAQFAQPGYGLTNAHLTWNSADGNWQAMFEIDNLTDELYYNNKTVAYTGGGDVNGQPGLPRTYLFTLRRYFAPAEPTRAAYTPPPAPVPVAPAAAPPAPAPELQRSFQVFFDFDKSEITDAAARVIQQAADSIKAGNIVQISVIGHTDTVGSAKYNQALSERRAAAVRTQLVSDGVPAGEIATSGVGKAGLLVPTADGVREPQNRRAEILLK